MTLQKRPAVIGIVASASVTLVGLGLDMGGFSNPQLGVALIIVGLAGLAVVLTLFTWSRLPPLLRRWILNLPWVQTALAEQRRSADAPANQLSENLKVAQADLKRLRATLADESDQRRRAESRCADLDLRLAEIEKQNLPSDQFLEDLESLAPRETVLRLHELYSACEPAFEFAYESLDSDICSRAQAGDQLKIAMLVRHCVLRSYRRQKDRLDDLFGIPPESCTVAAFNSLVAQFAKVLTDNYPEVANWFVQAGESIFGGRENLVASSVYSSLYRRHVDALQELWRARRRSDIGTVEEWHRSLEQLLPPPKPPADLAPSQPSE